MRIGLMQGRAFFFDEIRLINITGRDGEVEGLGKLIDREFADLTMRIALLREEVDRLQVVEGNELGGECVLNQDSNLSRVGLSFFVLSL
jgi:hypothetical protein